MRTVELHLRDCSQKCAQVDKRCGRDASGRAEWASSVPLDRSKGMGEVELDQLMGEVELDQVVDFLARDDQLNMTG